MTELLCPLCGGHRLGRALRANGRAYRPCLLCGLIHLDPCDRLEPSAERAHYATHQNDSGDPRYRAFLARLAHPLQKRLLTGAAGLDYGSGPGPTLSVMLRERGFPMEIYDPYFQPDKAVLERSYDFVTCTETAEHFHDPAAEFARLDDLLRPGGHLALMTGILEEGRAFEEWYYARDPTHVSFYRPVTMEWLARRFGWIADRPHRNVFIFRKHR